ncbi:MAG: hypothetical protein IJ332_00675 [Clostridia bacterium]|nr:hypothetical protein [Clostridia bacterium]
MTKKLTFCSMMAVMGIICLLLSNILQTNTIFLYLFSTLFTYICTEEHGIKYGILTYAVISLAGFMIVVDKVSIIAYIIVVGYYPVIKNIIDHFNINKILKWSLKLVFAVAVATIALFMLKSMMPENLNFAVLYPAGIAVFVIYDTMLAMGIKFYVLRLRKFK